MDILITILAITLGVRLCYELYKDHKNKKDYLKELKSRGKVRETKERKEARQYFRKTILGKFLG